MSDEDTEYDEDTNENWKLTFPQLYVALTMSLGTSIGGFTESWTSSGTRPGGNSIVIDKSTESWITSLVPLGASCGNGIAGSMENWFGKKMTLAIASIPALLGYIILAQSDVIMIIYSGRFLTGVTIGIFGLVQPNYIGHAIEPKLRIYVETFLSGFWRFGILVCHIVKHTVTWLDASYFAAGICLAFFIMVIPMCETPEQYVKLGKTEKAERSIQQFSGRDIDYTNEVKQLEDHAERKKENKVSIFDLFQEESRRSVIILLILTLFQQTTGISALTYKGKTYYQFMQIEMSTNICGIMQAVVGIVGAVIKPFFRNTQGPLMRYGPAVLMLVSITVAGLYFIIVIHGLGNSNNIQQKDWIPITCVMGYIVGYCLEFGFSFDLPVGEQLSDAAKKPTVETMNTLTWLLRFVITKNVTYLSTGILDFIPSLCVCAISVIATVIVKLHFADKPEKKTEHTENSSEVGEEEEEDTYSSFKCDRYCACAYM